MHSLVVFLFLLSPAIVYTQQVRLGCDNTSCDFLIKNLSGDSLFGIRGNGSWFFDQDITTTGQLFALKYRGLNLMEGYALNGSPLLNLFGKVYINSPTNYIGSIFEVARNNQTLFAAGWDDGRPIAGVPGEFEADSLDAYNANEIKVITYLRTQSGCYTGSWQQCSEAKLKKNIGRIENPLDKVLKLRGVSFDWRKEEFPSFKLEEGRKIGLIAQEVENVFPELVKTESDGIKSVNYSNLSEVLVEAMKEQQKIINDQKQEIREQNRELEDLKKQVSSLEAEISKQQDKIDLILSKMKGQ
jgi:hypothetical protein